MKLNGDSSSVELWRRRVQTHHAQSESVMDDSLREGDFWRSLAPAFRADPRRTDDEALNVLLELVDRDSTVLDVGGGAGRFALALAFKCRQVTVVDPSESMLEQLGEVSEEAGISNVHAVKSDWETANVDPADLVLCSHVVYGVAEIRPFIEKLAAHSRKTVALVSFVDSPQAGISSLWEPVHGEPRINLPALPELMNVLWEMDIYPNVGMLSSTRSQRFESVEAAKEEFARRLFIGTNAEAQQRLENVVESYLQRTEEGYQIRGARPIRQGIITWEV